jgi:hypothetical protein
MPPLPDDIRLVEERLLTREVRASEQELDRLIADDFVEFGISGRVYSKRDVIAALTRDPTPHPGLQIDELRVVEVAPSVALATYRYGASLRSSLWRRGATGWQVVFHQGTRTGSGSQ